MESSDSPTVLPFNERNDKVHKSRLFGPTCDSIDLISDEIMLPKFAIGYMWRTLVHIRYSSIYSVHENISEFSLSSPFMIRSNCLAISFSKWGNRVYNMGFSYEPPQVAYLLGLNLITMFWFWFWFWFSLSYTI